MKNFYDNFKIGDIIAYNEIIDKRQTGKVLHFVLDEETLNNIKKFEDSSNYHNMRVDNEKKL